MSDGNERTNTVGGRPRCREWMAAPVSHMLEETKLLLRYNITNIESDDAMERKPEMIMPWRPGYAG